MAFRRKLSDALHPLLSGGFPLGFLGCRPEFCLSCPSTDCQATADEDFINHRDSLPPPSKRFLSLSRRLFSTSHFLCAATKKGRVTASKRLWQQSQNCARLGIPQFRQLVCVMSPQYNQFRNALCRPANGASLLSAGCQVSGRRLRTRAPRTTPMAIPRVKPYLRNGG